MRGLAPSGTVSFLFTDIEGSTRLLARLGDRYAAVLADHDRLLRNAFDAHGGREVDHPGDGFFVAFSRARDAVAAATAAQRALAGHLWPDGVAVRVRMGIHTGEPLEGPAPYIGLGVHRAARIAAAAHGGQVVLSRATRELLDDLPPHTTLRDLGAHRLRDFDHPEHVFQLTATDAEDKPFPPLRTVDAGERLPRPATPLPQPATALLGRGADLDRLGATLCEPGVRLVTIVGPGGVGKTRLALAGAAACDHAFAAGARFVELASLPAASDPASHIARALHVGVRDGEASSAALLRVLGEEECLLVLDNFEHVMTGVPLVHDLAVGCPRLTVLVTSREPLRLSIEHQYRLDPLAVDGPAVDLFLERARSREPGYARDSGDARRIEEICRRLDGLPLALELAAARAPLLAPEDLLARLGRDLAVLGSGAADAPERQRTLRATLEWSVRLLTEAERRAFARLAAFTGGVTVDVAETVAEAPLDLLDALVAKQLLRRRGTRLFMLETVRQYGVEQLEAGPDGDRLRGRLAAWSVDLLRRSVPQLRGPDGISHLPAIEAELPTWTATLAWAIAAADCASTLELAAELGELWWRTSRWEEGTRWLTAALDACEVAPPGLRARVVLARARLLHRRHLDRYGDDLDAAIRLFRAAGDHAGMALALAYRTGVDLSRGDADQAQADTEEARRLAARSGDDFVIGTVLAETLRSQGGFDDLQQTGEAAVAALERHNDIVGVAFACSMTGYHALADERDQEAMVWLERGVRAAHQAGDERVLCHVSGNLGIARLLTGDLDGAEQALVDTLALARPAAMEHLADEALLAMAALVAERGDAATAARLLHAALESRRVLALPDEDQVELRLRRRFLEPVRARCPDAWESAMADRALGFDDALEFALALARGRHRA